MKPILRGALPHFQASKDKQEKIAAVSWDGSIKARFGHLCIPKLRFLFWFLFQPT